MPKRQCPFTESNRPQMKNHVGMKELSEGVMGTTVMNEVYDRTLKMMYQSSRHKENSQPKVLPSSEASCQPQASQLCVLPGQRKLNFMGQIVGHYSKEQVESGGQSAAAQTFTPIGCGGCSNVPQMASVCHFCERCLCEICCRSCDVCKYPYCSDCSTTRYDDGAVHNVLCLTCI